MADRISQDVVEALGVGAPNARVAQGVAEALGTGAPKARLSQDLVEALGTGSTFARASQISIELLVRSVDVVMPPIYPTLPGQPAFSFLWTPEFFNLSEKGPSGVDVDLGLASSGVHEFELTYQALRNDFGPSSVEFKTMMGFFLRLGGQSGRFLFPNPTDRSVTSQLIATTDGIASVFGPIVRTFGLGENTGTEAVGYVDPVAPFKLYLDGVLQDASSYTLIQTTPGDQKIKFYSTPTTGKVITVDMSYYYYCKFADDKVQFDQFMRELWGLKKIVIRSVRAAST